VNDDRVLVDFRTADDAGVYRWAGGPALVQTVDFFTPIVDDPYIYGQIAAVNALSDIYAMGGRPLTALAIAAFPRSGLEPDTMGRVFRGGFDKLREAGVVLLGGHTVQDPEIKFGYAVTGEVDPARVLSNAGARPGDDIILTKPIGTGVVATAIKFGRAPRATIDAAVTVMLTFNREAADAVRRLPRGSVHACTDVTGFGLVGHLSELAAASRVSIRLRAGDVPLLPGTIELAAQNRAGGMTTNEEHFGRRVRVTGEIPPSRLHLLFDPQTSGGLLIAVDSSETHTLASDLEAEGVLAARIGQVERQGEVLILLE
jgi:selenide,water dikinase